MGPEPAQVPGRVAGRSGRDESGSPRGARRNQTDPSTTELTALGAVVELRDRSRVCIRQIRRSDEELLVSGFAQLSPESRYRRFLAPLPELTRSMVHSLIDVDHHDHEALVALDERCEEGLGIARYVRNPDRPDTGEVAVTVIDVWQGRGLGTLLLDVIRARAREEGSGPSPPSCWPRSD